MRRIEKVPTSSPYARDAHKGDRGRVLIVAGSITMSGAARLAGWGALRGGAGLVTVATPDVCQPMVAADLPCAMTLPLPSRKGALTGTGAPDALAREFDAVGIGPGLTTRVLPFLRKFRVHAPAVVDADALNVLAEHPEIRRSWRGPCVLTPHPGEAERLLGAPIGSKPRERLAAAEQLADSYRAIVVLKGAEEIVTDGDSYFVSRIGNPGMASGGSGDVLTGLIASRLAQVTDPLDAVIQAVHVHRTAGDLAAAAVGETGMIATDLVANLPAALEEIISKPRGKSKRTGSRRRG